MRYLVLNFFFIKISNKLEKSGFVKKNINSIMCSHLNKTCLPCNSSKISFHIWIFKNWIYTLHNNVHMLSSLYIYVMGSHLANRACHTIYLAKQCLYVEFTPCWANITLKKNPLDLVFKIDFENWTSYLVFFEENPFQNPERISNTF
jgi:hypothetical protein